MTAEQDLRDLMKIPDNYKVLFLSGRRIISSLRMIPMNLMKNGVADYIVTGQWAKKAYAGGTEIRKGQQDRIFSEDQDILLHSGLLRSAGQLRMQIMYIFVKIIPFTEPNSRHFRIPKAKTLVADVSSCFLSEPVDVTKYGMIYGGVQKNIGPAGMVIAIIREDLITDDVLPGTPTMLKYKTHADARFSLQYTELLTASMCAEKYSNG